MRHFILMFLTLVTLPLTAQAELEVDITQGQMEPLPILAMNIGTPRIRPVPIRAARVMDIIPLIQMVPGAFHPSLSNVI